MGKLKKNEKKSLLHKLLEFKLAGTVSYAKYLAAQLEGSEGVAIRKAYTKYVKKEIASTAKKIARLEGKLKKSAPKLEKKVKLVKTKAVPAAKDVKVSTSEPAAPKAKSVAVKPSAKSVAARPSAASSAKAAAPAKPKTSAVSKKEPVTKK